MGIDYTIKNDIFTLVIEGDFSAETIIGALKTGMADDRFTPPMRALFDARKAENPFAAETHEEEKTPYAEICNCFIPHWAVVAASDTILFNVAQIICAVSDLRGVDMRSYADIDEARSRLTWSNFYQQDPFCRIQSVSCRPHFTHQRISF